MASPRCGGSTTSWTRRSSSWTWSQRQHRRFWMPTRTGEKLGTWKFENSIFNGFQKLRARNQDPPCSYKQVMEILQTTCQAAGRQVFSLQIGDPFSATKPAVSPPASKSPDKPQTTTGGGVGDDNNRTKNRKGAKDKKPKLPAWQVLEEKRSRLCPLFNLGICSKTSEQCSKEHRCSKKIGPTHLCWEPHPEAECNKTISVKS